MSGPSKRGKAPRVNVMKSRGLGASQVRRDTLLQQGATAFALTQLPDAELDTPVADLPLATVGSAEQGSPPAAASKAGEPVTARHVVDRLRAERLDRVPLAKVRDASHQPRRWYDPTSMAELTNDIRERGLLQPVVLRALSDVERATEIAAGNAVEYELVFGHRRFRAFGRLAADPDAAVAGRFAALPAFVARPEEMTALDARLLTSAENRQRDDLGPLELARDIAAVRDMLAAHSHGSADYDLAVFYGMVQTAPDETGQSRLAARKAPGIVSEYRRIGETITDAVLVAAGVTTSTPGGGQAIDWELAAGLRKGELYRVARLQSEPARVDALRKLAMKLREQRAPRHRGARETEGAHRFSYETLRDTGDFYMRLSKPVQPDSYTVADGRRYLGDVEPLVALLAEIAGERQAVYRPQNPNMPGTYVLLTKPPAELTDEERRTALATLQTLVDEVRGSKPT